MWLNEDVAISYPVLFSKGRLPFPLPKLFLFFLPMTPEADAVARPPTACSPFRKSDGPLPGSDPLIAQVYGPDTTAIRHFDFV